MDRNILISHKMRISEMLENFHCDLFPRSRIAIPDYEIRFLDFGRDVVCFQSQKILLKNFVFGLRARNGKDWAAED